VCGDQHHVSGRAGTNATTAIRDRRRLDRTRPVSAETPLICWRTGGVVLVSDLIGPRSTA
jgi:hypothetical protein